MRRQFGEKVGSTWGGGGEKVRNDGMMQGESSVLKKGFHQFLSYVRRAQHTL